MVFFGEYQISFTSPGRLVLPKKLRELLKGNIFILTKGFNFCLAGYDKEDWESRAKDLLQVSLLEQDNLQKRRFVFSSAVYLEIDEQGRFVIPRNLLAYSDLSDKVVIIGAGDHFEIWSYGRWEKYLKELNN
ncbi:division/cell wall cluster transcriptional repressor MraZ [Candidatus Roizmanbacteria bacterium]|jgi:MraZ protein|nr:division/cell wall cluster transcriptional repressor MraZ [Candidatus Roizmanbacteria bacterium]